MNNKYKLTFVVQKQFQEDLRKSVINEGYGLRGKSKWVSEAIRNLLEIKSFPLLVKLNDEMKSFEKKETVVIDHVTQELLEQAIVTVRKSYPALEGVKSRIIRTAILQRLLRQ